MGGPVEGALMPSHSLSVFPNRKRCVLHVQQDVFYSTTLVGGRFSPSPEMAQSVRDCHNPANEKPLHFQCPDSSNGLFVDKQLLPLSPFLCKRKFFSFVLCTCLWFPHSLPALNCNSLLFLNKFMFADKVTFIFKVSNINSGYCKAIMILRRSDNTYLHIDLRSFIFSSL